MPKLTISEAARMAQISRQHLYRKFINPGKISVSKEDDKVFIEASELLRVFPNAKYVTSENNQNPHVVQQNITVTDEIVTLLKTQLAEAKEREEWYKSQIEDLRGQNVLLLEDKSGKKKRKFLGIF